MIWIMKMCGKHLIVDFWCQHLKNLCNKCDSVLLKNMMPDNAVNSPTKKLLDSQKNMCLLCKNNVIEFHLFKQIAYGNNLSVTKLLRDVPRHSHHVVCKKLLNVFHVVTTLSENQ